MSKYPLLTSPIKIGSKIFKHRMVAAPIYCGPFALMPFFSDVLFNGIVTRAEGGSAEVIVGETAVDFEHANREPFPPVDYSVHAGPTFDRLKEIADRCKAAGAVTLIELSHCGRSRMDIPGMGFAIGPSEGKNEDGTDVIPMDRALMDQCIDSFINCAKFMQAAGYEGVMIHAGHGWLIHQFLSPLHNHRTDEYGGSMENRARFPLELFKAMREAMGPDFLIEMRISGEECQPGGTTAEDMAEFCAMVQDYIDIVHVSVGTYRNPILSGEFSSLYQPHGLNAPAAKVIKAAVKIPVALVGGINSPEQGEQLLADGVCDLISLGRQLTADPDFPNKVVEGRQDDIAKCCRCFRCFAGPLEGVIEDPTTMFGCSVNPKAFFFDREVLDSKPAASRNVLIIGGGIAGMQAALTAAERGHQVTLCEKSHQLGGLLHFADTDQYKVDLGAFLKLMITRVNNSNVTVKLNCDVKPEDIASYEADAVIIAVGSHPLTPEIPGVENTVRAIDVYGKEEELGEYVIMLGGGLVGCEVGLHLAKLGKKVTVLKRSEKLAPDGYAMHRLGMLDEMSRMLQAHTGVTPVEISKGFVTTVDSEGETKVWAADSIINAMGMAPNPTEDLVKAAGDAKVFVIGDCNGAFKVYDCVLEAFTAAMNIL